MLDLSCQLCLTSILPGMNRFYRMRIAMLGFDFVGRFTNLLCVLELTS